jgi:flagellar hook-associated protein 1 FlgK
MSIMNNALSGSLAAQFALTTTSQNIANLQTAGYTRQGVQLSALGPGVGVRSGGNGVEVSRLLRFSDGYKSQQMWRAASDLGQRSQTQPYLSQIERLMGDDQSSLSHGLDIFFTALNAAGADPTSSPLRQQVITAADSMAQHFNSIYKVLGSQLLSVQQQRGAIMPQLNSQVQDIAMLNQKITALAGSSSSNTSALVDERDRAIDGLAKLVALEVQEQPDGSSSVSLRGGQPLVIGGLAGTISVATSAAGVQSLNLGFATSTFALNSSTIGGQLGGLGDLENNTLLPLRQSVADMAGAIASQVNTQLAAGTDMNGVAGTPLFQFNPISSTGMLRIVAGIDANQLAFSADGTPGDSANLQKLIDIHSKPVVLASIGSVLLGDADTQLVGKLAIDSQQNRSLLETATTLRHQAEDDWASTSGVNKDEEAVNLVEYQNMFQANMKVISVANALFDATLAMFN